MEILNAFLTGRAACLPTPSAFDISMLFSIHGCYNHKNSPSFKVILHCSFTNHFREKQQQRSFQNIQNVNPKFEMYTRNDMSYSLNVS